MRKIEELDKKIQEVMKVKIQEPVDYEQKILNTIRNHVNNHKEKRTIHIIQNRIVAIACTSFILVSGFVLATQIAYNKIWKEPIPVETQQPTWERIENPSNEQVENLITEEEAINIGKEIMQKLNVQVQDFKKVVLFKYDENNKDSSQYILSTLQNTDRGINIKLNGLTGKLISFDDMDVYKYKQDKITKDEAIERANEICDVLEIIAENDNYEIMNAEEIQIVTTGFLHDVWNVQYARKYNGIYDKNTSFTIMFIVSNGKTIPYSVAGGAKASSFENNPIEISKEHAIEIAVNKEKEFSSEEIISVTAEQSIEKMNLFVYGLENNLLNLIGYKIENRIRNVWSVEIKHHEGTVINIPIELWDEYKTDEKRLELRKEKANKKYYIDATTGEIIGGIQTSA